MEITDVIINYQQLSKPTMYPKSPFSIFSTSHLAPFQMSRFMDSLWICPLMWRTSVTLKGNGSGVKRQHNPKFEKCTRRLLVFLKIKENDYKIHVVMPQKAKPTCTNSGVPISDSVLLCQVQYSGCGLC